MILGIQNLLHNPSILKNKRIGLVANCASVDFEFTSSVDLLRSDPRINLTTVFGAQQGFWGETQDNMVEWQSGKYPHTNLPMFSLYGETRKPTAEMLNNVDVLVFDVQDVGTRVYTFIWTMALCIQACAKLKKEFVVCDRPNPINGIDVEGNVSLIENASFVALYPLPMRHGMTMGEIANYVNAEFKIGCELTVIPMQTWSRAQWGDEAKMPWVIPSANMPTLDAATVYPGTVIFEGTNVSEGRGTTRPFEFIGAPFVDGFELAKAMESYQLPGYKLRPCKFIPTFQKHAGQVCGGVHIHVTDRKYFCPFKTGVALLKVIRDLWPKDFAWKQPPYEYVFDRLPIDVIFGSDWIRKDLEVETDFSNMVDRWEKETKEFLKTREQYLMYG